MPVQRVKDRGELRRRRWVRRDVTGIVEDGRHSDCGRSQTPTAMRTQRGDLGFHSGDRAPRCVLRRHLTGSRPVANGRAVACPSARFETGPPRSTVIHRGSTILKSGRVTVDVLHQLVGD